MIKQFVLVNRHLVDLNPLFVGDEACAPGHTFGPSVRQYTLLHYIVSGRGKLQNSEGEHEAQAGQAFLIRPGEVTTYSADENDPWHYQWVAFDGALSERVWSMPSVFDFPAGLIQQMLDAAEESQPEYRIAGLLYQMYARLFEGRSRQHYVRRVQDYIRALYMKPIRVEEIATEIGLDRRYLSRIFHERTGESIRDFLIRVRMEAACEYLMRGFSVEESAHLCGYEDVFNFSKMFKSRYSLSPLQWKKVQEKK